MRLWSAPARQMFFGDVGRVFLQPLILLLIKIILCDLIRLFVYMDTMMPKGLVYAGMRTCIINRMFLQSQPDSGVPVHFLESVLVWICPWGFAAMLFVQLATSCHLTKDCDLHTGWLNNPPGKASHAAGLDVVSSFSPCWLRHKVAARTTAHVRLQPSFCIREINCM